MPIDSTVAAAIIAGACSIVVQVLVLRYSAKELYAELDKRSELADARLEAKLDSQKTITDTKLDELTREVREHNNFALRIPIIESKIDTHERSFVRVHQRIDELQGRLDGK